MQKNSTRRTVLLVAAFLSAGLFLYIYTAFSPESSRLFPKCIFLQLTGVRCPGCGSQRALHALLNGDIAAAFRFNALLVSMIPYLVLLTCASMLRTRVPRFYAALCHPAIIYAIFILVILWWILRNVFGW